MIKTLYPSKPDPHVLSLVLSRAKGDAVSPRLANRYSRFALSHRSCGDGFCQSPKRYNVLKDHRWPSLPMADHTVGAPSFACFSRRVGGRLIAPWASPFTPRMPGTKSSPNPHSPALARTRVEDRSGNCSSANPRVSPADRAAPDCGAYSAVSPPASSLSKH
jgi:hypothetical protein